MDNWLLQKWAGFWRLKYFKTGKSVFWVIGASPVCDGWDSTGKLRYYHYQGE